VQLLGCDGAPQASLWADGLLQMLTGKQIIHVRPPSSSFAPAFETRPAPDIPRPQSGWGSVRAHAFFELVSF
jgi:hypothetical protein